ncbi:unnamed protein product, partial [marine sediment metagenome]
MKKYKTFVIEGKKLVNSIHKDESSLADLAMKVCTIQLGGQKRGFYTLANFAEDVGVCRKKMTRYVQKRKIQLTLDKNSIEYDPKKLGSMQRVIENLGGDSSKYENLKAV